MSDSLSGVIIPLVIPVDAPASLASGVQALAASLETTEFSNACLQLQQSFCYLTWHFSDYTTRYLQHLKIECSACSPFGHARIEQHQKTLQDNLELLAKAAETNSEAGDIFRVFYVGGLRARHSSPRRHTRLLGLGGQAIRGYRSILEWCHLELGDEEFSGELRCQRELRRYLPILREWLDSSSGHFRQMKLQAWFVATAVPASTTETTTAPDTSLKNKLPTEALAALKSHHTEEVSVTLSLANFPTPPLLANHQILFDEQLAHLDPDACLTLGRLAGLAVQYIFAITASALRSINQLDPALKKRLDTGLTLRQKQTSLSFLFKTIEQYRNETPLLEQVAYAIQAPTGGKLSDFLINTWGGGHTFAEFCSETHKAESPPLWQERFLPGIRVWLQQFSAWFAQAEHYFQEPGEQGLIGLTIQLGDEHLEIDRKALQLDTTTLRIDLSELKQLLLPPAPAQTMSAPAPVEIEAQEVIKEVIPAPAPVEIEVQEVIKEVIPAPAPVAIEAQEVVEEVIPAPAPVAIEAQEVIEEVIPVPAPVEIEAQEVIKEVIPAPAPVEIEAQAVIKEVIPAPALVEIEAQEVIKEVIPAPAPVELKAQEVIKEVQERQWYGPVLALDLRQQCHESQTAEPLLLLMSFLLQYTTGITAEWSEEKKHKAAANIAVVFEHILHDLQDKTDSPVIEPLGAASDPDSINFWLHQPETQAWICTDRDFRPEVLNKLESWLETLQPFFKDSEQLFEEPTACGTLEGVVAYQDHFLEFVDYPINVGLTTSSFWHITAKTPGPDLTLPTEFSPVSDNAPITEEAIIAVVETTLSTSKVTTSEHAVSVDTSAIDLSTLNLSALPECVCQYYEKIWQGPPGLESAAAALEFIIQYYAGLLASASIHVGIVEASHLSAWHSDSNLLQRQAMIQQILDATAACSDSTLADLRQVFLGPVLAETWKNQSNQLVTLAMNLRKGEQTELERAIYIINQWMQAGESFLATVENLTEPVDSRGYLELVVQQGEHFFELIEPEYAIHLIHPGDEHWQDSACYKNFSIPADSQELSGNSDSFEELSGGAVLEQDELFFAAPEHLQYQDQLMEALFKQTEPVATEPLSQSQAITQSSSHQDTQTEPVSATAFNYQLNDAMEQLLQEPPEEASPPPPSQEAVDETAAITQKETRAPARLDALPVKESTPEFIVVDPPKLDYEICYEGKEGSLHIGRIQLKNIGGGNLKGTIKSNHPCLRVTPSVFRSNEAEISYRIDESDRPSNIQKIGLTLHFSGQKVDISIDKMLPSKKLKNLASKMLGFVKGLRKKGS